jgi:hypothetical protein
MLTSDGPKLLEYNCRFGDPEAQAVLPLLTDDLAELALACCNGELGDRRIGDPSRRGLHRRGRGRRLPGAPTTGARHRLRRRDHRRAAVPRRHRWHRRHRRPRPGRHGSRRRPGHRPRSRLHPHRTISFDGMQVRRDIGWRAIGAGLSSYAAAGVDIDEGTRAVDQMKAAVERTHGAAVLKGVGSFGGVFSGAALKAMDEPVLVASTDGVGTKVELAARLGRYRGVGADIVNHCIDDVLVQGAARCSSSTTSPVASSTPTRWPRWSPAWPRRARCRLRAAGRRDRRDARRVRTGRVRHRRHAGRGGRPGQAAAVARLSPGDVLLGVASNGPHTNGYSLLRKLFDWLPMDAVPTGFDCTLGEALLKSHRNYLPVLEAAHRRRPGEGTRPHHGRRPAREPAAGAARRHRRRRAPRLVAGAAAVPTSCARWHVGMDTTSCTARSTWASAWSSSAPRPTSRWCRRRSRDHVGDRRARRRRAEGAGARFSFLAVRRRLASASSPAATARTRRPSSMPVPTVNDGGGDGRRQRPGRGTFARPRRCGRLPAVHVGRRPGRDPAPTTTHASPTSSPASTPTGWCSPAGCASSR